jgi:hypothetical protein
MKGLYLGLVFTIARLLIYNPSSIQHRRKFYFVFETVLFALNTIAFTGMPLLGQLMWITHRDKVDPYQFYIKKSTSVSEYLAIGDLAQASSMFLGDAFLVCTTDC